jgi:intermediate peptidase
LAIAEEKLLQGSSGITFKVLEPTILISMIPSLRARLRSTTSLTFEMLNPLRRPSWICRQCLRQQRRLQGQISQRTIASAATATAQSSKPIDHTLPDYTAPSTNHDDKALRLIFDSKPFWRDFSQPKEGPTSHKRGLVQNQYLTSPEGFEEFALVTRQKCQAIVHSVLNASSVDEYRRMARDLDRLSDLLCRVIDIADFMRATHPDPKIQDAATRAYALMFEYMNVLNTTTGLHEQLKKAASNPDVTSHWSEEEKTVAHLLIKDFLKSAIDLPPRERRLFVELSNEISQVGPDFVDSMESEAQHLVFEGSRLGGMDPTMVRQLTSWGKVTMPTIGGIATMAMNSVRDEDVRRRLYLANRTASRTQVHRLEVLLQKRAELARLAGYQSFSHMTLSDKMAQSPVAVNNFLTALNADNAPAVRQEVASLLTLKQTDHPSSASSSILLHAWDHAYYLSRQLSLSAPRPSSRKPDFLSSYFSLGTVMQGLSRLFTRLYGVRLVPRETSPGETWNADVRRLDVIDEANGHIAVIYCDLFERAGKSPNPAHFTLRCSREITPSEIASDPSHHPNDGMATAVSPATGTLHQLPTIALICDFAAPTPSFPSFSPKKTPSKPALLSHHEVTTLFHEMGHAIHSILGRTALQTVSGTRCATDFAELPSVLMEHFARDSSVLSLFARHYETDAPFPPDMLPSTSPSTRVGAAIETENQILMALLDQAYHSSLPLDADFSSTKTFHDISARHSHSSPEPASTSWQGFFGHLYGYGASYYSYLFDRAIAGKVWKEVFRAGERDGALSRENGEKYKREVLRWGGGREGWECVAGVLGEEWRWMGKGGEGAMREVGKWGVGD